MKKLLKKSLLAIASITMICFAMTALADNTLHDGERLYSRYNDFLSSDNGQFKLTMQSDGNLVLRNLGIHALYCTTDGCNGTWSTGTAGQDVEFCEMLDGNLVLYGSGGQVVWDSNTAGNPGAYLVVQNNGDMVINKPQVIWEINTTLKPIKPIKPCSRGRLDSILCPPRYPPITVQ